jgi:uncharacterized protein (DUF302 family)
MDYTIQTTVAADFDAVVDATTDALAEEGFGVLCDIDVQATFAEKLDEEFSQYRILGACNPALAHEGLTEDPALGALLPCNVVVSEAEDGRVVVRAVDPGELVGIAENAALDDIAAEVSDRYERVVDAVDAAFETPAEA